MTGEAARFAWERFYPTGVPRAFEPPDAPLWRFLSDGAGRDAGADAIHFGDDVLTYGELEDAATRAARSLAPVPGAVMLALGNTPAFVANYFGALRAGRVVTAVDPQLTAPELRARAEDAEPAVLITQAGALETCLEAMDGLPSPPAILLADSAVEADDDAPAPPEAAEVAVLQYTSGTTGDSKAAMMTHRNLVANALQNNAWFAWGPDDVILGALPLHHTWGMGCVMNATLGAGASMVLLERFDAEAAVDAIRRHGVTVAYGSATMFARLLDAAGADAPQAFAGLRYVKAGAMLVGDGVPARWAEAVPRVPMILGYGLTEAGPEVTNNPPHRAKSGTVGIPLPGTDVRIADPAAPDRESSTGEEGEIQVRGPQVTPGYWRRPEATASALLEGGWLRTGDLGRFDDEGYLVVVDRLKDLIKFRGYSVVPAEVERTLLAHPQVGEAVVVGLPDDDDGEVPVAFVLPAPGCRPDLAELETLLASAPS